MHHSMAHPILSGAETKILESKLFGGDESVEWQAMLVAGAAIGRRALNDFLEIGGFPRDGRLLVLAGKGHNGGDALLAAAYISQQYPEVQIDVLLVYGPKQLRPLSLRTWQQLQTEHSPKVKVVTLKSLRRSYDLCLDGLFGFQFHPPLDGTSIEVLEAVNALPVRLRAAVDLPSGGDTPAAFRADFTYATGVLKQSLLAMPNAGRLRYLDLGWWVGSAKFSSASKQAAYNPITTDTYSGSDRVLTDGILQPLRGWRDPYTDKRGQGHLFVVAGSRHYPGAALMTVMAALRSGAGLVSAFVPESLVSAFAAQVPEAIWVGWPETPDGGLALEGHHLLKERIARASALVVGPGMGREAETLALAADIVKSSTVPVLVDADALQASVIANSNGSLVLTPHLGEFSRISDGLELHDFATKTRATVLLKGPITRITAGDEVYHSIFGGPVLARGGSGDLLAGIIGAQLAQNPHEVLPSVCRGVAWHGLAADALARTHGAVAVRTTQLLDFLGTALRLRS